MRQIRGSELKRFNKHQPKHNLEIVVILDNLQYATNVANIFRTADAAKVSELLLVGITKTPPFGKDLQKASRHKERSVSWKKFDTSGEAIQYVKKKGFKVIVLETTDEAENIKHWSANNKNLKLAIIVGNEDQGVSKKTLEKVDSSLMIPMYGKGASLNVGVSLAVCLYTIILNQTTF